MIGGSCLCGGIAFEFAQAREFRNCHCSRCRKAKGSAFAANIFVKPGDFRWIKGEELLTSYRLPTAQRFGNVFCKTCGSPMPRVVAQIDSVVVPAGALDDDPKIRATHHIFAGSKAPWHTITDGLPEYDAYPPT